MLNRCIGAAAAAGGVNRGRCHWHVVFYMRLNGWGILQMFNERIDVGDVGVGGCGAIGVIDALLGSGGRAFLLALVHRFHALTRIGRHVCSTDGIFCCARVLNERFGGGITLLIFSERVGGVGAGTVVLAIGGNIIGNFGARLGSVRSASLRLPALLRNALGYVGGAFRNAFRCRFRRFNSLLMLFLLFHPFRHIAGAFCDAFGHCIDDCRLERRGRRAQPRAERERGSHGVSGRRRERSCRSAGGRRSSVRASAGAGGDRSRGCERVRGVAGCRAGTRAGSRPCASARAAECSGAPQRVRGEVRG
mmetsp:Transcript_9276/g.37972  ORF Transcript_9276/g.37972 Transcript_9276/m.37972 type:complete len:306 (-) Transcript_9276:4-921(-)